MTDQNYALRMFLIHETLAHAWGDEWNTIDDSDRDAIACDFWAAKCTATEYVGRIWRGNLKSYAMCINGDIPSAD